MKGAYYSEIYMLDEWELHIYAIIPLSPILEVCGWFIANDADWTNLGFWCIFRSQINNNQKTNKPKLSLFVLAEWKYAYTR